MKTQPCTSGLLKLSWQGGSADIAPCLRSAYLKYLVVNFLPSNTGVLPTALRIIQLPLSMRGISLKVLCRLLTSTSESSSPATNRERQRSNGVQLCTGGQQLSV